MHANCNLVIKISYGEKIIPDSYILDTLKRSYSYIVRANKCVVHTRDLSHCLSASDTGIKTSEMTKSKQIRENSYF